MTGPANIARIIAIVLIAWLTCAVAQAASPRDAIKKLPKFSHSSTFFVTETDKPADPLSFRHDENYTGVWKIDWVPYKFTFPSGTTTSFKLHFETLLTDRLNKITRKSSDSRKDSYSFIFEFISPKRFKASHVINRNDTYNASSTSLARTWRVEQTNTTNVSWTPPGLPLMAVGRQIVSNYNFKGLQQTGASESDTIQYRLDYKQDSSSLGQRFQGLFETQETSNYINNKATNRDKTQFTGYRKLPLGSAGNFTLDYFFEDTNKNDASHNAVNSTTTSKYGLKWTGDFNPYPLSYNFSYLSELTDISSQPRARSITNRLLGLNFKPPVPKGKSAGLGFSYVITEFEDASRETSNEKQKLVWNFSPNPLVQSNLSYEINNATNELINEHTDEKELLSGGLSYNIPGSRGSLNGTVMQEVQRQPTEGFRRVANGVNLSTNFKLGPQANMTLFYNQLYNDSRDHPIALPASNENLISGFTYSLTSGQGFDLRATWRQRYGVLPSKRKTDTQSLDLIITYNTPAKWKYQLKLLSSDETSSPSGLPSGSSYSMGDEIQLKVSYTL